MQSSTSDSSRRAYGRNSGRLADSLRSVSSSAGRLPQMWRMPGSRLAYTVFSTLRSRLPVMAENSSRNRPMSTASSAASAASCPTSIPAAAMSRTWRR